MKKLLIWVAVLFVAAGCGSVDSDGSDSVKPGTPEADLVALEDGNFAFCNDSTYSDNAEVKNTCSSHDEVDYWLAPYGECEDGDVIALAEEDCGFNGKIVRLMAQDYEPTTTTSPPTTTTSTTAAPTTTEPPTTTAPPTTAAPTTAAPAPTSPPAPAPTSPPAPSTVTPGAFCSGAGSTGVSSGGVPMTCSTQKCTGEPYQQPRWRKTNC